MSERRELRDSDCLQPSTFASRSRSAQPRAELPLVKTGVSEIRIPGDNRGRGSRVFTADIYETLGRKDRAFAVAPGGQRYDLTTQTIHDESVTPLGDIRRLHGTSGEPDPPPRPVA